MNIEIKLQNSYGRLAQREPFLLTDNDAPFLVFDCDYVLSDTVVTVCCAEGKKQLRLRDLNSGFTLPAEFVKAGEVNVTVDLLIKGNTVKTWHVEPIVFAEHDAGFVGLPELEQILADLAAVKSYGATIDALTKALQDVDKRLADVEDIVKDTLE